MNVILTVDILRQYVNVEENFEVDRLIPMELASKVSFLNKYFNDSLITQLLTGEPDAPTTITRQAYNLLMQAHCSHAVLRYIPQGEVKLSEFGITRVENDQTKSAYANQIKQLKSELEDSAYMAIGALIELMENDSTATFTTNWNASVGYASRNLLIIKSAEEFNLLEPMYRHQTTFISLIPIMLEVQQFDLVNKYTQAIVDEMILNLVGMNASKKSARASLRYAIVSLTVAKALEKNLVKLTPSGVSAFYDSDASNSDSANAGTPDNTSPAYRNRIESANKWFNLAKKTLEDGGFLPISTITRKRFTA